MNTMTPETGEALFFDPFAETGAQQEFDPIASHQSLWERYKNSEIEHDYTADKFVADSQALMMNSHFAGRFEEAAMLASQMHAMCGGDEHLSKAVMGNEGFREMLGPLESHGDHDHVESHSPEHEDIEDKKSKDKKKKRRRWFDMLLAKT